MKLAKAIEALKFDTRLVKWNTQRGWVTDEERKQYLESLEDCSANAAPIDLSDEAPSADSVKH